MFSKLLLIYLIHSVSADAGSNSGYEIMPRCSDSPGTRMTFTPVEGYVGRYTAEHCTEEKLAQRRKQWALELAFYESPHNCNKIGKKYVFGTTHSTNIDWVSSNHNCSDNQTVCMSVQFDLIFSACYSIRTNFSGDWRDYYFNISNHYTEKDFDKNRADINIIMNDDFVSVMWHPGVPPSVYNVELCNQTNLSLCEPVPNCTTVDKMAIKCYLDPPHGCYTIYLRHLGTWTAEHFYRQASVPHNFCRNDTSSQAVSGSPWSAWVWAAAGGCVLLGAAACAARALARALANTKKQKEVLRKWLVSDNSEPVSSVRPACRHVLLLYAREGALAARAVQALKDALQDVIDGQVYDIFSPEVMSLCAGAPAAWVRGMLQRHDVAVLLLQSPALHALYTTHMMDTDKGAQLVSPLLYRRVVPRVPQFGDALLQYALRITTEDVHARDNYRKYYVATISDLPTESLPCLVPYRRYPLPPAAPLLLHELAGGGRGRGEQGEGEARLALALAEFVEHTRENPDYLMDELMVIDT